MSTRTIADVSDAKKSRIKAEPPWFESLAKIMDPAPELLDRLASEFSPIGTNLEPPNTWWTAFQMFVTEKMVGDVLSGAATEKLRQAVWAIYATTYWGSLEQRGIYGIPEPVINMGMSSAVPSEDSVIGLVAQLPLRYAALAAEDDVLFHYLSVLLREEPVTGPLHGAAYNSGFLEVISEGRPLGECPAHLRAQTGSIRVNSRDFMRIDYAQPVPNWLKECRASYEKAVRANPESLERIVTGTSGMKDLRVMWSEALAWGHHNWGGNALKKWSQAYFEALLHWSIVLNFGLEAIALATLTALIEHDAKTARRAVVGNALYMASWGSYLIGYLDPIGRLPELISD